MDILTLVIIGGIAGWLASTILKQQQNLWMNIGVGIVGAFIGNFIFGFLGIAISGIIGSVVSATCGAVALLLLIGFFWK